MKTYIFAASRSSRWRLTFALTLLVAFCVFAFAPRLSNARPQRAKAIIMIENDSDYDIYHLYLSAHDEDRWGEDQLGEKVIKSGTTFTLTDIPCDHYDIKIVDHDGDSCEVQDIEMCKDHTHWTITNKALLKCEGFGS